MKEVDISIVIVNWKVRPLLEKCLQAVLTDIEGLNAEIFVVDNDSRDGTPEMIMAEYPQVTMIALAHNRGFAQANNLALREATGKYIFLLNPDTEVQGGFFKTIINYFVSHPQIGMIGPRVLNSDFSLQPSVRRFPDLFSQIIVLLKLRSFKFGKKLLAKHLALDFDYNREQDAQQIMGAAIAMTKDAFEKIGYFDERFYIWFEEVDYCQRAQKQGIIIRYLPTASILHHSGASFKKQKIFKKQLIFNWSLLYYFFKHKPIWQTLLIVIILPINLFLTALYAWWSSSKDDDQNG